MFTGIRNMGIGMGERFGDSKKVNMATFLNNTIKMRLLSNEEKWLIMHSKTSLRIASLLSAMVSFSMGIQELPQTEVILTLSDPNEKLINREKLIESLKHDRNSCYYVPPYFAIFGSDRPLTTKRISLPKGKVMKNVRPKGTKTNRKIYR